jgi:nucleolin
LRLYSTTEESDRIASAASELATESETSAAASEAGVSSDATSEAAYGSAPVRPGDADTASRSIYMGNIYFDITEDQIKELASQYGPVEKARLMKDVRGFSRG